MAEVAQEVVAVAVAVQFLVVEVLVLKVASLVEVVASIAPKSVCQMAAQDV